MNRSLLSLSLLLSLLVWTPCAPASDLDRVDVLTRGGATALALKLVDLYQPTPDLPDAWMPWEKRRYAIYAMQGDWDAIGRRAEKLSGSKLPPAFVRWGLTEAARARLAAQDTEGARRLLRQLLWDTPAGGATRAELDGQIIEWRQMVIRSYLMDDDIASAQAAVLRYKQEFRVNSEPWRVLEASILVRAGRPRAVFDVLGGLHSHEARLLLHLAGLRSGDYKPADVMRQARSIARETTNKPAAERQAWALLAEAAVAAKDNKSLVEALERALSFPPALARGDHLFKVNADGLWAAYVALGTDQLAKARLAKAKDEDWIKHARAYKRDDAMLARAEWGVLASNGRSAASRDTGHQQLVDSLYGDGRFGVVRALYMASAKYPQLTDIPEIVRYRLADQALDSFDIKLAGQLIDDLHNPPPGEDPDLWSLRRARVLIYAGDFRGAITLLSNILAGKSKLSEAFVDRYTQVMFDLQAADRNNEAGVLLESLYNLTDSVRAQRELLFWMADSRAAVGQLQQAAELYLRSATHGHPTGGDIWGQTARFHAAETLAKAGFTADARAVYQNLLRFTEDAKQRAIIERSIQQLWLLEHKSGTP